MAKDDIDYDALLSDDDEIDLGMGELDFGDDDTKEPPKGNAFTEFGKGLKNTLFNMDTGRGAAVSLLRHSAPKGYVVAYDFFDKLVGDVKDAGDKIVNDNASELAEIADNLADHLEGKELPFGIEGRFKDLKDELRRIADAKDAQRPGILPSDSDNESELKEFLEESQLNQELRSAQAEKTEARRFAEERADRLVTARINNEKLDRIANGVTATARGVQLSTTFDRKITRTYYRQSLQIQYRMFQALRDIRYLSNLSYKSTAEAFKKLVYNTSLPDFIRSQTHASKLKRHYGADAKTLGNFNSGYWDSLSKNVREGVSEKLSEVFQAVSAVTGDDLILKEFFATPGRALGSAVGLGGNFVLNDIIAPIVGGRIRKHTSKLSDKLGGYDHALRHHVSDVPGALQRFVNGQGGNNVFTSMLRGFLDQYLPQFQNNLALDKTGYHNLDKPAQFTQAVQRSIVDIIPGYLSRIYNEIRVWRTGAIDGDVYDITQGKFTKRQVASRNLRENIVSSMDRENIQGNLENFHKQFDPNNTLSSKARNTFNMALLREMQNNHNFEPDRLLDGDLYTGADDKTRNEILNLLKSRYTFNEDGSLEGTTENRARRYSDGRYYRELKETLPNPTNDIKRLAGTGIYSELHRAGIIYTIDGRDQINNERLLEWMLTKSQNKSSLNDPRRYGPFFKKGVLRPIMTPKGFEQGRYLSKTSKKPIRELKDITGPVVDVDGKVILTYRDLRHGIRNAKGEIVFRIGGKLQDKVDELAGRAPNRFADDYEEEESGNEAEEGDDLDEDEDEPEEDTLKGRAKRRIKRTKRRIKRGIDSVRERVKRPGTGTWDGGGRYSPSYVAEVVARVRGGNEDDLLSLYLNDPEALAKDASDVDELLKIERARLPRGIREIVTHTDETIEKLKRGETTIKEVVEDHKRSIERRGRQVRDKAKGHYDRVRGMSRQELQETIRSKAEALRERAKKEKERLGESVREIADTVDPDKTVKRNIEKAKRAIKKTYTDSDYEDFSELIENINNNENYTEEEKEVARNFVLAVQEANRKAGREKRRKALEDKAKEGKAWVEDKAREVSEAINDNEHVKSAKEKAKDIAKRADDALGISEKTDAVKERAKALDKRYDITTRVESALGEIKDNKAYRKAKAQFERLKRAGSKEELENLAGKIRDQLDWEKNKATLEEKGRRALGAVNDLRRGGWSSVYSRLKGGAKGLAERFRKRNEDISDDVEDDDLSVSEQHERVADNIRESDENARQARLDEEDARLNEQRYKNEHREGPSPFVPRDAKEARRQMKLGLKRDRKRRVEVDDVDLSGDEFSDDMLLRKAQDIYTMGEKAPIIKRRELLAGVLFDRETAKPIRSLDDVTGIVVDRYGNVVLDLDDIRNGLYTQYGERLYDTERTLESRFGKNIKEEGLIRGTLNSLRSIRNSPHRSILPGLIHGICDIYVEGETIPRMTARGIRQRLYTDMNTGKPIDSTKDITGPVLEGNEVILSPEEIKHLVDNNGKKVFIQGAFTRVKRRVIKGVKDGSVWMAKKYMTFTRWYYRKLFGHTGNLLEAFFKGNYSGRLLAGIADSVYRVTKGFGEFYYNGLTRGGKFLKSAVTGAHDALRGGRLLTKMSTGVAHLKDRTKEMLGKAPESVRDGISKVGESLKKTRERLGNNQALKELGKKVTALSGTIGQKLGDMKNGFMSRFGHPLIEKGKKAFALLGLKARAILKKDGRSNLTGEQARDPQLGLLAGINDKIAELLPKRRRRGEAKEIEEASEERLKREAQARKKGPFSWLSSIFGRKKKKKDEDGDDNDSGSSNSRDRGWGETEKQREKRRKRNEQRRRRDRARDRRDRMQGRSNGSRATRRAGRGLARGGMNLGRMGLNTVTGTVGRVLGEKGLEKVVGKDKASTILDWLGIAETADDLTGGNVKKGILNFLKPLATRAGGLAWRGIVGLSRLAMADKRVAIAAAVVGSGIALFTYFKGRHSKEEMEFVNYRLAQYGVYGDEDLSGRVIKLEEEIEKYRKGSSIDYDRVKEYVLGRVFEVEDSDQSQMLNTVQWFTKRFMPIHQKHISAIEQVKPGTALGDVGGKLSTDEAVNYLVGTTFPTTGETPYSYSYPLKGKAISTSVATITAMFDALKLRISKDSGHDRTTYATLATMNADGSKGRKGGDDEAANNLTERDLMTKNGVVKGLDGIKAVNRQEGINGESKTVKGAFSYSMQRQANSKVVTDYLRPMQQFRYYAYGNIALTKDVVTKMAALEDYMIPFLKYTDKAVSIDYYDDKMDIREIYRILGVLITGGYWANLIRMDAEERYHHQQDTMMWFRNVFLPIFLSWAEGVDSLKKNISIASSDVTTDYEQQYEICQRMMTVMQGTTTTSWFRTVNVGPDGTLSREDTLLLQDKMQMLLDDLKKSIKDKPVNMAVAKPSQQTRLGDTNDAKVVSTNKGPNDGNMKTENAAPVKSSLSSYLDNPGDSQGEPKPTGGIANNGFSIRNMAEGSMPGATQATMDGRPPLTSDPSGGGNVAMGSGSGGVYDAIPLPKKDGDLESAKPTMEAISKITGVDLNTLLSMSGVESGFKAGIKAGTSSATGWFQMINSTWKNMVNTVGKKYGIAPWKGQGRDPRMADPRINGLMGAEYIKMNYNGLKQRIGREPTAGDLYMAHFMGLGGAGKILNAPRNGIAAQLFPTEASANRSLFWKSTGQPRTVQELIELMTGKLYRFANKYLGGIGGQSVGSSSLDPGMVTSETPGSAAVQQSISNPSVGDTTGMSDKPRSVEMTAVTPSGSNESSVGAGSISNTAAPSAGVVEGDNSVPSIPSDDSSTQASTTVPASPQEKEEMRRKETTDSVSQYHIDSLGYQKQIAQNTGTMIDLLRASLNASSGEGAAVGELPKTAKEKSVARATEVGVQSGRVNNSFRTF